MKVDLIRKVPLFSTLTDEEFNQLAHVFVARAYRKGQAHEGVSATRSKARERALKREPHRAASRAELSRQARSAARRRSAADRSAAARKAARTKGPRRRSEAARKAARTRALRG